MRLSTGYALCAVVGLMVTACNDGPKLGGRGESCRARTDCASGLACLAGVCTQNNFRVAPAARVCARIECATPEDCCNPLSPTQAEECQQLDSTCKSLSTGSVPVEEIPSCQEFFLNCDCSRACEAGACIATCTNNLQCENVLDRPTCIANRCAACQADTDCPTQMGRPGVCNEGLCQAGCRDRRDCEYLQTCDEATQRCVEAGCETDRECIAVSGNARSVCIDTECVLPCDNDLECNVGANYSFSACIRGICTYLGCQTDEECRAELAIPPQGLNPRTTAVCQDPPPEPAPAP